MSEINRWSTSAAGTVQNAAGYFPEGQAPSTLNDAARTIMAELRRDWQTHNPDVTATFSAQTYSVTYDRNLSSGELSQVFCFIPDAANTGTASLNINALGAKEILTQSGLHMPAGMIAAQRPVVVAYNKSTDKYHLVGGADSVAAPEYLTNVSGTDTITAQSTYLQGSYTVGQRFQFLPAGDNATTTPSLNINGIGALTLLKESGEPIWYGDLNAEQYATVIYNGTNFILLKGSPSVYNTATVSSTATVDFTSLPHGVRRVTVTFNGISISDAGNLKIRIGSSGGFETTGYTGAEIRTNSSGTAAYTATSGTGFDLVIANDTRTLTGVFRLESHSPTIWMASWIAYSSGSFVNHGTGSVTISGARLDRIRLTTSTGSNFDGGDATVTCG